MRARWYWLLAAAAALAAALVWVLRAPLVEALLRQGLAASGGELVALDGLRLERGVVALDHLRLRLPDGAEQAARHLLLRYRLRGGLSLRLRVEELQLALPQPIRLDDVVIVEGEWGRIEEIRNTFVVVRIWDLRRLARTGSDPAVRAVVVRINLDLSDSVCWNEHQAAEIGDRWWLARYGVTLAEIDVAGEEGIGHGGCEADYWSAVPSVWDLRDNLRPFVDAYPRALQEESFQN